MISETFKLIAARLDDLLRSLITDFSLAEQAEVQEFMDAGEYGLALETLCAIILEENKPVDETITRRVQELNELMKLDSPHVDSFLSTSNDGLD